MIIFVVKIMIISISSFRKEGLRGILVSCEFQKSLSNSPFTKGRESIHHYEKSPRKRKNIP